MVLTICIGKRSKLFYTTSHLVHLTVLHTDISDGCCSTGDIHIGQYYIGCYCYNDLHNCLVAHWYTTTAALMNRRYTTAALMNRWYTTAALMTRRWADLTS